MKTERDNHLSELTSTLLPLIGVLAISLMALTREQREYVRDVRDGGECWFPECRAGHCVCGAKNVHEATCKKEVHHVLPSRYLKTFGVDPDNIEQILLSVGEPAHRTKIHPDINEARKQYHMNKNSYHEVFDARDEKIKRHEPYWVTIWDRAMMVYALLNTQKAHAKGLSMPVQEKHDRT